MTISKPADPGKMTPSPDAWLADRLTLRARLSPMSTAVRIWFGIKIFSLD
jgi:hypothetical protein